MSHNEKTVVDNYSNTSFEENRASSSRANSMEFHYTKKALSGFINKDTSVLEIGCGTGYYGMFFTDKCKNYTGIDLSPDNIKTFQDKINNSNLKNLYALVGDATNLTSLCDKSYDVVLVLGPMYHLDSREREKVFDESRRICKDNGIIAYAYINKIGVYIKGCLMAPEKYPNKEVNNNVLIKGIDDIRPDLFFFTMPEEMEEMANKHHLTILKNMGVDFVFNDNLINNMNDEQLEAWMEISDIMYSSSSCTGVSNHALLICRNSIETGD